MSPPSSLILAQRSPYLSRETARSEEEEAMTDGAIGEIVIEFIGEAVKLIEENERKELLRGMSSAAAAAAASSSSSSSCSPQPSSTSRCLSSYPLSACLPSSPVVLLNSPGTANISSVTPSGGLMENEEEESSNMIELLTPPATDPDSPASETIIGLIPDEVCLLESEDSKAIDESTCQSSSTCQANSNASSIVCKWTNCDWPGTYDDLVDHIREIHVELQPYHNHQHHASCTSSSASSPTAFSAISSRNSSKSDASEARESIVDYCHTSKHHHHHHHQQQQQQAHHQEQQMYVCLWQGCKVYGKESLSRNWLERHVLMHSGPRPFKCIIDNCGARFKSRLALERHVNSHFNGSFVDSGSNAASVCGDNTETGSDILTTNNSSSNHVGPMMMRAKCANGFPPSFANCTLNGAASSSGGTTPNKYLKRKKVNKPKRRSVNLKSCQDFFDQRIMQQVQYRLFQLNATTGLDICGSQRDITFQTTVIARRKEDKTGLSNVLLHYLPENILPDVWVPESQLDQLSVKTLPLSSLPSEALADLMEFSPIQREGRKQRRK